MRKQLLGVFLPLLALVLIAAAETQSTGAEASGHAALQKVNVVRGDDGIRLEIIARGAVTPKLSTLESPARLVVDLPNTVTASTQSHINVGSDGVKDVRLAMDGRTPPTTRVVVDLDKACRYELVPGSDNKIVVKLHTAVSAAKTATKPATVRAPKTVAAVPPAPEVKKEVAVSQPAPAIAAPASQQPTESASSANDYVFVEPSYKPKDASAEVKPAVADPSVRATVAAAKFVERPEGNLLPAPSAAMQASASAPQPAVNMAAEQKSQMTQRPAASGPKYTGEPISVNLKDVDLDRKSVV